MSNDIASRIQTAMKQRGWSQALLAERAGLTRVAITHIVRRNRVNPQASTLIAIAQALECSIHWLVTGTEYCATDTQSRLPTGQSMAPTASPYDTDPKAAADFIRGLVGDGTKATLGTLDVHDLLEGFIARRGLNGQLLREALYHHIDALIRR